MKSTTKIDLHTEYVRHGVVNSAPVSVFPRRTNVMVELSDYYIAIFLLLSFWQRSDLSNLR
jgi:hypothetical protein